MTDPPTWAQIGLVTLAATWVSIALYTLRRSLTDLWVAYGKERDRADLFIRLLFDRETTAHRCHCHDESPPSPPSPHSGHG